MGKFIVHLKDAILRKSWKINRPFKCQLDRMPQVGLKLDFSWIILFLSNGYNFCMDKRNSELLFVSTGYLD